MQRYTIRRVGLLSSFKVGCLWGIIASAIIWGFFFLMFSFLYGTSMIGIVDQMGGFQVTTLLGGGLLTIVIGYLFIVSIYGILVALIAWFYALIYNLIARFTGGLQIELAQEGGSQFSAAEQQLPKERTLPDWLE